MTDHSKQRIRDDHATEVEWTMVGESLVMQKLRNAMHKMAPTDLPVLIGGETGTGKELVARILHQNSRRGRGPFVAVNCPALPNELFQAEVFGYEKGAFTGADRQNEGRIDAAHGGTLFLDEIGDLSMNTQAVLLRFLQEGVFERLGSSVSIRADVRVLTATHIDLWKAVEAGRFREDLYYRLTTLTLGVPPLRMRGDDIGRLADFFMNTLTADLGLRRHELTPNARSRLAAHCWPGNVRELRNAILQSLVLSESRRIAAADLQLTDSKKQNGDGGRTLKECRRTAEREAIESALRDSWGSVETAASRLGISKAQLYRLIHSHELGPYTSGARKPV
ncbi:MAG: sigma-54 interaction domain-containing protein [Candidatus Wenzhouxiangella sp. M2_3B_020]